MVSLLDSKLGFGMCCALGAAAAVMGVFYLRDGAPAAVAPPARTASWDGPLGPGALAAPAAADFKPAAIATATAPGGKPLLDDAGRLKIDPALQRLFDAYLKNGTPREQDLRAYLQGRLVQPALGQAESLAADYLRYLRAEAALRASARFTQPDPAGLSAAQVEQMQAWQQQRAQLRERMLGSAVAQTWFGIEEADCRTALADWQTMRAPAGAEDVDSNELRARRLHGAMLAQRRNEKAQACAAQLMDRPAPEGPAA